MSTEKQVQSRERGEDRKGKGKAKDQNQNTKQNHNENQNQDQDEGQGQEEQGEGKQQMKEIRRPPPLPAVKGTIGAIESPSRRTFFSGSPNSTIRGNHSRGPSYDHNAHFMVPDSPSPTPTGNRQQGGQQQQRDEFRIRDRPVFRADPTLGSCFDRLRLNKKDAIRSLFGA